jgi:hypothetical protein
MLRPLLRQLQQRRPDWRGAQLRMLCHACMSLHPLRNADCQQRCHRIAHVLTWPAHLQQLLNGTCNFDWGAQKCFYSTFDCANVTAANLTSGSGDDTLLAASCATQNVTRSLADLAVYDASVCTTGEQGGS